MPSPLPKSHKWCFNFLSSLAYFFFLLFPLTFSMSWVLEGGRRGIWEIIHQSTYVGDITEGGGKKEVKGKMLEDKRGFNLDEKEPWWWLLLSMTESVAVGKTDLAYLKEILTFLFISDQKKKKEDYNIKKRILSLKRIHLFYFSLVHCPFVHFLCLLCSFLYTRAPHDVTSTRWQRFFPGYFGFMNRIHSENLHTLNADIKTAHCHKTTNKRYM